MALGGAGAGFVVVTGVGGGLRRGEVPVSLDLRPPRPRVDLVMGPGLRPRVETILVLRGAGEADFMDSSVCACNISIFCRLV